MKKCQKCNMLFAHDKRSRCLYCNAILMTLEDEKEPEQVELMPITNSLIEQVVKDRGASATHQKQQYVIGSYFRTRTFHFLYCFSRSEYRMGVLQKRWLIQPLNMSSFLVIPWVIVNFIDSFFARFMYNGYCEKCGWKYNKAASADGKCDPEECEYHKEYSKIIEEIMSGHISISESEFEREAAQKIREGKRSAYFDLCSNRSKYEPIIDIAAIWISIGIMVYFIVGGIYPLTMALINEVNTMEFDFEPPRVEVEFLP